jgi:hypothetical protein
MGRPQFENQTQITAMASKRVDYIEGSSVASLPSSTYERFTIFSPKNTISRVMNIRQQFLAITETTTVANKYIYLSNRFPDGSGVGVYRLRGDSDADLIFDKGELEAKNPVYVPNDLAGLNNRIVQAEFDEVIGMNVTFQHGAGVSTTAERSYAIFLSEEVVDR